VLNGFLDPYLDINTLKTIPPQSLQTIFYFTEGGQLMPLDVAPGGRVNNGGGALIDQHEEDLKRTKKFAKNKPALKIELLHKYAEQDETARKHAANLIGTIAGAFREINKTVTNHEKSEVVNAQDRREVYRKLIYDLQTKRPDAPNLSGADRAFLFLADMVFDIEINNDVSYRFIKEKKEYEEFLEYAKKTSPIIEEERKKEEKERENADLKKKMDGEKKKLADENKKKDEENKRRELKKKEEELRKKEEKQKASEELKNQEELKKLAELQKKMEQQLKDEKLKKEREEKEAKEEEQKKPQHEEPQKQKKEGFV
jgi:hypothetical protein